MPIATKLALAFAAAVTGAVGAYSGSSIGTMAMLSHGDTGLPGGYDPAYAEAHAEDGRPLPNHYALTTPQGRYEIGELAMRGLFSQARFGGGIEARGSDAAADYAFAEADYADEADYAFPPPEEAPEPVLARAPADPLFAPGGAEPAAGEAVPLPAEADDAAAAPLAEPAEAPVAAP